MAEPLPICYLNGDYLPLREARVSPLDRSFLFGDGVYEVMPVFAGRPFRYLPHYQRLARSLRELRMHELPQQIWHDVIRELISRNGSGDLYIYLQVSRGMEYGRNHAPFPDVPPTIFAYATPLLPPTTDAVENGLACITAQDTRWARCDIKSVALLANVMLRQQAVDAGANETILLRDGWLTDASASSVHVVRGGVIITPPHSNRLLPGTTRSAMEELAAAAQIPCESAPVSEAQLRSAEEIWLGAATRTIASVTKLDGKPVGNGRPGPLWQRMHDEFAQQISRLAHQPW